MDEKKETRQLKSDDPIGSNDGTTTNLPDVPSLPAGTDDIGGTVVFNDTNPNAIALGGTVQLTDTLPKRVRVILPDGSEQVFESFRPHLIVGRKSKSNKVEIDIDMAPFDKDFNAISRVHAMLAPDRNRIIVKDLQSINGTQLNGRALKPTQPYTVQSGDQIKFGNLKVQVFLDY